MTARWSVFIECTWVVFRVFVPNLKHIKWIPTWKSISVVQYTTSLNRFAIATKIYSNLKSYKLTRLACNTAGFYKYNNVTCLITYRYSLTDYWLTESLLYVHKCFFLLYFLYILQQVPVCGALICKLNYREYKVVFPL